MSLINQMLQDLEQRNASSGKTEPISGEVRTVSAAKSAPPRLLVGLLALSLLAAGAWFYLNQKPLPAPAPPLPVPAKALPAAPPPVVAAPVAASP